MEPVTDPQDPAEVYARAARELADSPAYVRWARAVAGDDELLALLRTLPEREQQANLVFAAVRWHHPALVDAADPGPGLREALLGTGAADVLDTIRTRRTQTNEVRRLTALVVALGLLDAGPLALVELGTSAGLCLHPDRYDYAWQGDDRTRRLEGSGGALLTTRASGPVPVATRHPDVVARIGIDLHPVDVADPDQVAWLENLVWPGQGERLRRLRTGVAVARSQPPTLLAGDMLERLDEALALAETSGGRPVVQHSAAVAYLDAPERERLAARLGDLVSAGRCHWVALEGPRVLNLPDTPDAATRHPFSHAFCLAIDGRTVATAHGHGATLAWHG